MDKPTSILFYCQRCDRLSNPYEIQQHGGLCAHCQCERWRVVVKYAGGPAGDGGADLAATLALNAIGLGLVAVTGTGFVTRGLVSSGGFSHDPGDTVYSDVLGQNIIAACVASGGNPIQFAAEIQRQDAEAHRERLGRRGAQSCRYCGVLVVPTPTKPWTMFGACSKLCCARALGTERYADIEDQVHAALGRAPDTPEVAKAKRLTASVPVACRCGQTYSVPRTFLGTRRPCPHCQTLNEVRE